MSTWISAHIFHAGDLDALITQVAGPLAGDLNPDGFFFLRYWEGGPHLRLRLRGSDPGRAERELAGRAPAHLRAHPSARAATQQQYATAAARLASGERLPGHDDRLHANDTVEFIAYRPEHHAYGNPECMTAVEEHFTESSRLALRVLADPARTRTARRDPARRRHQHAGRMPGRPRPAARHLATAGRTDLPRPPRGTPRPGQAAMGSRRERAAGRLAQVYRQPA